MAARQRHRWHWTGRFMSWWSWIRSLYAGWTLDNPNALLIASNRRLSYYPRGQKPTSPATIDPSHEFIWAEENDAVILDRPISCHEDKARDANAGASIDYSQARYRSEAKPLSGIFQSVSPLLN